MKFKGMLVFRYIGIVLSLALASCVCAQDLPTEECVCDPSHFVDNFDNAERVFRGKIVSGQLNLNSDSVRFTVEVLNELRGEVGSQIVLSTRFEEDCGFKVLAGAEWIFLQGKNDRSVSQCDLRLDFPGVDADYLSAAILLVDSNQSTLSRFNDALGHYLAEGASAPNIWMVFSLAQKLDPTAPVSFGETNMTFRNLEVFVKQNRVTSHVWH